MAELGALSLRIVAEGDGTVLRALDQVDRKAKQVGSTPLKLYFDPKGAEQAQKVVAGVSAGAKAATPAQAALNKEIAESIRYYSLLARTTDTTNRKLVEDVRGGIAAQKAYAQSVGASAEQMLRLELIQDQFERKVMRGGAAVAAMSPKVRTGTAALSALAIAIATGDGSLRGLAVSAGVATSMLAETFGAGKWAMYASGIGAVVIALASLVGVMHELAKAKPLNEVLQARLANTRTLLDAETKLAQLRERAAQAERQSLQNDPKSFLPGVQLFRNNAAAQARKDVEDFIVVVQQLRSEERRARQEANLDAIVSAAQAQAGLQIAALAKVRTDEDRAYAEGQRSLRDYFAARAEIITRETAQEIKALEAQRAALLTARPGESPADALTRQAQARDVQTQIATTRLRGAARTTDNAAAEAAAAKELSLKVLAYEAQIAQARGQTHQTRLQQIQREGEEVRKAVFQQTRDQTAADTAAKSFVDTLGAQANAQQAQADLQLLLADLETRRSLIQQDVAAGLMTQEEAARRVAQIEQSALPTLTEMVNRIAAFAAILKDPELLADVEKLRAALGGLGVNASAIATMEQTAQGIAQSLGSSIADAFADGLASGDPGAAIQQFGAQVLSALGNVFIQIGVANIKAGTLLKGLATFLIANPLAAIGIGVALSALGRSLGGGRGSSGAGGSAGGTAGGAVSAGTDSITGYVFGPNAQTPLASIPRQIRSTVDQLRALTRPSTSVALSSRITSADLRLASPRPTGPSWGRPLVINSPEGQRVVSQATRDYGTRGG